MLQTDKQIAARLTVSRATVWRYTRTDPLGAYATGSPASNAHRTGSDS